MTVEFYNRIDLSELFEKESDLSDLLAESPEIGGDWKEEETWRLRAENNHLRT